MLTRIHIKDLAIVSSLELDLGAGMTVLTGETGAGKSIFIDALGLVLGDRADNTMIREGCERAEITAVFHTASLPEVTAWLEEQALDEGEECILRRVLSRNGASRAFINGRPAPIKLLQAVGEKLVDIHGQHAHQSLLRRSHQQDLLDEYADHGELRQKAAKLYRAWKEGKEQLQGLREAARDRAENMELLRYQVNELETLRLAPDELQTLNEEHARLSNADRLLEGCGRLLSELYDDEVSVQNKLAGANHELELLSQADPSLKAIGEMVEEAVIQIQEVARELSHYIDGMEVDPTRLPHLEQRLAEIQDLARKYRCKAAGLHGRLEEFRTRLEQLEHAGLHLTTLEQEVEQLREEYTGTADELDRGRRDNAHRLEQEVTEGIQHLSMPDGCLEIGVERLPEEQAGTSGWNRVEFRVTANPGQPPRPLEKVASGGELSRISLAIQVATTRCSGVPSLIFDEVDVGIGGGVAEIVGQQLRQLSVTRQVLCVTHLPQVAAIGQHHLQVSKKNEADTTVSGVTHLDREKRIHEIARMLGGVKITDQTLAHAREMVEHAQA